MTAVHSETERTYVLGGETRRRSALGVVTAAQAFGAAAYAVVWLAALVITQSLVVFLGGLLVGLAGWIVVRRRTATGDAWSSDTADRIAWRLAGRGRRPDFVPGHGPPREVGQIRVLSYAPPASPESPMAIVHHRDHRHRTWAGGHLTATFEVTGGGDGILPMRAVNASGHQMERLLGGLSGANLPVDQLDISTRVLPVHPDAYRTHMEALLDPATPARLRASMRQLAGWAAGNTEEYRSYATVRMPLQQLATRLPAGADPDRLCAEVFVLLGDVVRRAGAAGLALRAVLGPRRLGALIRHLHDPDTDIDTLDGVTSAVDGWAHTRTPGATWVRIDGAARPWYHAVASVPRDAWPLHPVGARWMEHLVTGAHPATIRTVHTQWRLVPKIRARDEARLAHTYDRADQHGQRRRGQVSTGESEASMSASRQVLNDLLTPVVGGVRPAVRVHVSAPSTEELAAARTRLTAAAENGGVTRLRWNDHRHHQALLTVLPLCRGIK